MTHRSVRRAPFRAPGVREEGFAVNIGESQPEVAAIGAVARDRDGHARAAVTVSVPISRLDADRIAELAPAVLAAARKAGERLWGDPQPSTRTSLTPGQHL